MLALAAGLLTAQDMAPVASTPVVELKGTITKVRVEWGAGMPLLEVKAGKETVAVMLGSMRFLMEKDFNPKAGEAVAMNGYQMNGRVIAIRVELPEQKKSLQFRDEKGYPLWMRGQYGKMKGKK